MATGAERARASRERRLAADPLIFRAAEQARNRDLYRRIHVPKLPTKACANCGALKFDNGTYCSSPECVLVRNRVRQRRHMHERRARMLGNEWEPFDPREVYDRDGWICGICDLPVDPDLTCPNPGSVSLDHVVPVSLHGSHTRENTRCSHLGCNIKRGNRAA